MIRQKNNLMRSMTATNRSRKDPFESGIQQDSGTVLVVDDEAHLVGMYASMLEDRHTVLTATSGEDALDSLSEEVEVVLLDRRMPDISGDEALEIIHEKGYDCQIAMVTSVEPESDIVELAFDAYLVKPIRKKDLHELVDDLLLRGRYDSDARELLSTASRVAALESQLDETELASNPEYRELRERWARFETVDGELENELTERSDTGLVFRDALARVQEWTHE